MARWDAAAQYSTPNCNSGGMGTSYGVVVHIAEGTYQGTISWQQNPSAEVSSFFINGKNGERAQMVDTADRAWTQASGNTHWRGIEHEGYGGDSLTSAQVESLAQEIAWLWSVDGQAWPLRVLAGDPRQVTSPGNGGVTWHGAGGSEWGGHYDCPGDPIVNQLGLVVARAQQITGGGGDDMAVFQFGMTDGPVPGGLYNGVVGACFWWVPNSDINTKFVSFANSHGVPIDTSLGAITMADATCYFGPYIPGDVGSGQPGPQGPAGPPGEPGAPGAKGDAAVLPDGAYLKIVPEDQPQRS